MPRSISDVSQLTVKVISHAKSETSQSRLHFDDGDVVSGFITKYIDLGEILRKVYLHRTAITTAHLVLLPSLGKLVVPLILGCTYVSYPKASTIGALIGYGVGHINGGLPQWAYIVNVLPAYCQDDELIHISSSWFLGQLQHCFQ